jgi:hypothetical protein
MGFVHATLLMVDASHMTAIPKSGSNNQNAPPEVLGGFFRQIYVI